MTDANVLADCNWNRRYNEDGISQFFITDFSLTHGLKDGVGTLTSLLLANSGNIRQNYTLTGNLINARNPGVKISHRVTVNSYYIDVGSIGSTELQDQGRGFWMVGTDEDVRYKLVYPAAPEYAVYAAGILDLSHYPSLFRFYAHQHDNMRCIRMTDFSLTDRDTGFKQTPILPRATQRTFILKGSISLNLEHLNGSEITRFIGITDRSRCRQLQMQTYIKSTYLVDFGKEEETVGNPILWMEDMHRTWIKLEAPCHCDYEADYNIAMDATINNVPAYNWRTDDQHSTETWRHVTNFRLTTQEGVLHDLEISDGDGVFILWGDLLAPPGSVCPTIPIKLYVKLLSLDTGNNSGDAEQGLWMIDVKNDMYKLVLPAAPDFRDMAAPMFRNWGKYLELYDALVYQNCSKRYSKYSKSADRNIVKWPIEQIHQAAETKFDVRWAKQNVDFLLRYMPGEFDINRSHVFFDSLVLQGTGNAPQPAPAPRQQAQSSRERPGAEVSVSKEKATSSKIASEKSDAKEKARDAIREKAGDMHKEKGKDKQHDSAVAAPPAAQQTARLATPATASNGGIAHPNGASAVLSGSTNSDPTAGKKRPLETTAHIPPNRTVEEVAGAALSRAQKVSSLFGNGSTASTDPNGTRAPGAPGWGETAVAAKPIKKKQMIALDMLSPTAAGATSSRAAAINPAAPPSTAPPAAKKARTEETTRAPISVSVLSAVTPVFRDSSEPARRSAVSTASNGVTSGSKSAAPLSLQQVPAPVHSDRQSATDQASRGAESGVLVESNFPCNHCKRKFKLDDCFDKMHEHGRNLLVMQRESSGSKDDQNIESAQNGSRVPSTRQDGPRDPRPEISSESVEPRDSRYAAPTRDDRRSAERDSYRNESNNYSDRRHQPADQASRNSYSEFLVESNIPCSHCKRKYKLEDCNNDMHEHGRNLLVMQRKTKEETRDVWGSSGERDSYADRGRDRDPVRDSSYDRYDSHRARYDSDYDHRRSYDRDERDERDERGYWRDRDERDYRSSRDGSSYGDWRDEREVVESDQLCNFCKSKKKKDRCRVPRHIDGQFMWCYKTQRDEPPRCDEFYSAPAGSDLRITDRNREREGSKDRQKHNDDRVPKNAVGNTEASKLTKPPSVRNENQTHAKASKVSAQGQFMDMDSDDFLVDDDSGKRPKAASREERGAPPGPPAKRSRYETDGILQGQSRVIATATPSITTNNSVTCSGSSNGSKVAERELEAGEVPEDVLEPPLPPPPPQLIVPVVGVPHPPPTPPPPALPFGPPSGPPPRLVPLAATASSPPPKISVPGGVSAPPPKPSRFAADGTIIVTARPPAPALPLGPPSGQPPSPVPMEVAASAPPPHISIPTVASAPPPKPSRFTFNSTVDSSGDSAGGTSKNQQNSNGHKNGVILDKTIEPNIYVPVPVANAVAKVSRFASEEILTASSENNSITSASSTTQGAARPSTLSILNAAVTAAPGSGSMSVANGTSKVSSDQPSKAGVATASTTEPATLSSVVGDADSATALSAKVTRKDEISLERVKYEKKHHAPSSDADGGADYLSRLMSTGKSTAKPSTPRGWGGLVKSTCSTSSTPAFAASSNSTAITAKGGMELVRLGSREEDPKKRLAQNNRHAGGVYTPSSTAPSGAATGSVRAVQDSASSPRGSSIASGMSRVESEAPTELVEVDLKAKPKKSSLRRVAATNGNTSTTANGGAERATTIRWGDLEGDGILSHVRRIPRAVYMNENIIESTPIPSLAIQLPFPTDAAGNFQVQWNDGSDSDSVQSS